MKRSLLKIIQTEKDLDILISYCKQTGYASIDFETTSTKYFLKDEYPLILGISFQPGSSYIIPLQHKDSPLKDTWYKFFKKFATEVLENANIIKIAWNLKFEYKWCLKYGVVLKGRLFDAMMAKYCLDEERPHGLKEFVTNMFVEHAGYEHTMDEDTEKNDWANKPFDKLCEYCGKDTDLTLRGYLYMEPRLIKNGFYNLFRNLLMMAVRLLAESEYRGMCIDRNYLEQLMGKYSLLIKTVEEKLEKTPKLLRYERKTKKEHLQNLLDDVKTEILKLSKEPDINKRLIQNRNKKLQSIMEGKFTKKEQWLPFNFNSPKQLIEFLFTSKHGLKLKPIKYTKPKKTAKTQKKERTPSTDEESLLKLAETDKSGFMQNLMELRGLTKLDGTYIRGMHNLLTDRDRVHASFHLMTVTGRLGCRAPNLQNIPRGNTAADIKIMFNCPPGFLLYEPDYSQAELRIVAELAQDKAMLDIFRRNYNIHVATACKMNGGIELYDKVKNILKKSGEMDAQTLALPENKEYLFWEKKKKIGKSLNFSILYMQGDKATSETLGCTEDEAAKFKKEWFSSFPQVRKWMKKQIEHARAHGYVPNLFGRKRRLHDIDNDMPYLRAEAERQSVNAPIQGAASDCGLFSQIIFREMILKGELPKDLLHVYTVHDSIGYYVRPKDVHKIVKVVEDIGKMPPTEDYFKFKIGGVEMKMSSEVGVNWGKLTGYDAWTNYEKLVEDGKI